MAAVSFADDPPPVAAAPATRAMIPGACALCPCVSARRWYALDESRSSRVDDDDDDDDGDGGDGDDDGDGDGDDAGSTTTYSYVAGKGTSRERRLPLVLVTSRARWRGAGARATSAQLCPPLARRRTTS